MISQPAINRYALTVALIMAVVVAAPAQARDAVPIVGVAPQYDTTHVYVAPEDIGSLHRQFPCDLRRSKQQTNNYHGYADAQQRDVAGASNSGRHHFTFWF